jgi:hypothetical protein
MAKLGGPVAALLDGGGVSTPAVPTLSDAVRAVAEALAAAGIRVTLDMKALNPPCAFLHPPDLAWRFRGGDMTVTHRLLLVCSAGDRTASYDRMSALLISAQSALGDRAVEAVPTDVETSDLSAFLTAYELHWADRVRQA